MQLLKNMFNIIYDCDNLNQIVVTVNWFLLSLIYWIGNYVPPFLCVLKLLALGVRSGGWCFSTDQEYTQLLKALVLIPLRVCYRDNFSNESFTSALSE